MEGIRGRQENVGLERASAFLSFEKKTGNDLNICRRRYRSRNGKVEDTWKSRKLIVQWSPTFLAPGTGFVEDDFSKDWEVGEWLWDDSSAVHSSSFPAVWPSV